MAENALAAVAALWVLFKGFPSAAIDGYSNVLTLTVPKPRSTYRGSVEVLHYAHEIFLTLRVTPLGEKLPYRFAGG